jgi:hypothetical protein
MDSLSDNQSRFRRFADYWWAGFKTAKEGLEMSLTVFALFCWLCGGLVYLFSPERGIPRGLPENPPLLLLVFGGLTILLALLWLPFRRHEALIVAHEQALAEAMAKLETLQSPKIKIECGPEIDGCRVESRHIAEAAKVGRPQVIKTGYHRIRVQSIGQTSIGRVRAAVIKVTKGSEILITGDPCDLLFAPASEMVSEKTIVNGIPEFVDVLTVDMHGQAYIQIRRGKEIHYLRPFGETGEYQIQIACGGDGISGGSETLKFKWGGTWESSHLQL